MTHEIDVAADDLMPYARCVEQVLGHRVSPPTLWRWTARGVKGQKLSTVLVGRRRYTTRNAVVAFIQRVTATATAEARPAAADPPERDRETQRRLEAAGLA